MDIMKVIKTGGSYEIFDNELETYDMLPVQSYVLRCSPLRGFYLESYSGIEIKEQKIYGVHIEKAEKVLRSFKVFDRNLGVILSGDKGIGKSLFAKLLAIKAMDRGIPVIVIDNYYSGLAAFIESIEQEVVIIFDEFEKVFGAERNSDPYDDDDKYPSSNQSKLLSLFDGMASGKKLFVITCNRVNYLDENLIGRPGRFHYHFVFDYPDAQEIREYLTDKLQEEYYGEIDEVIRFAYRVKLNYDCLRAIAMELNTGVGFREAIGDLNIITDYSVTPDYLVQVEFENGELTEPVRNSVYFGREKDQVNIHIDKTEREYQVEFRTADAELDIENGVYTVAADKLTAARSCYDGELVSMKKTAEIFKSKHIRQLVITRLFDRRNVDF